MPDLATLRLPMRKVYRIDLGFDLRGLAAPEPARKEHARVCGAAGGQQRAGARRRWSSPACRYVERSPTRPGPRARHARGGGARHDRRWLDRGTLRRFGVVVRHHELGFDRNAMTVFDLPDDGRCA